MSRAIRQWQCKACGHVKREEITIPKYFPDSTPLKVLARRARCTWCRTRGQCVISEWQRGYPPYSTESPGLSDDA